MKMLEDCIKEIDEKINFNQNDAQKELYKSIYYHLLDYKDILNKTIELNNEIDNISKRWRLVKKANEK
ncbi:hypothetical protein [Brachyspira aalborgi]|jgi:hypothetical protein|uniref:Uncharacterized protein n=1 Tax=Brachyspira aalborgi TaxID=29522 RepID=A0ABY3K6S6_9SPIR|nr:hypothetical protein [Brachyspira aalborgi]TXJ31158.1 hypothetical protein EPJ71_10515 [Brachyspira aalborgi]TXJ40048.1 hypothetical protein EPJ65_12455 [Brachyspira aalborgi]DAZ18866.1 MAG TPA: hypothetical protein [Caudoviricetes sp.]